MSGTQTSTTGHTRRQAAGNRWREPHARSAMSADGEAAPTGQAGAHPSDLRLDQWADMLGIGSKAVLTTHEAAAVLRVSEKSVREGIKDGTIPCVRLGRRLLVPVPMLLSSLLRGPTATEAAG